MSRVAQENQGLQTTYMDLEDLSDDGRELLAEIRHNTKVSVQPSTDVEFLTPFG